MISKFKKSKWTTTLFSIILIFSVALIGLTGCSLATKEDANKDTTDVSSSTSDTDSKVTPTPTITNSPSPEITNAPVKEETDNQSDSNPTNTELSATTESAQDDTVAAELVQDDAATIRPAQDDAAAAELTQDDTSTTRPAQDDISETRPAQVIAASTTKSEEVFYGDWVINSVLAYGAAGTYSKEDAESLVGKSLSFSADKATCFGDQPSYLEEVATNPVYRATDITSREFVSNYRMTFDKLGLEGDSVTEITAVNSERKGCTFLVKDKNTLIVYGGGTYFELVR